MISSLSRIKCFTESFYPLSPFFVGYSKLRMSCLKEGLQNMNNVKGELPIDETEEEVDLPVKEVLIAPKERIKKKKVALLIAYSGQGYLGLQRNPGTKTIEEDLLLAMLKAELINEEIFNQPQLIQFQRAARTDKGVSALRQVLSLKLPENSEAAVINNYLPDKIRAIAIKRVTKGFNCKGSCDARTYSYTTPTFAFSTHGQDVTETYRLSSSDHIRVNQILQMYEGTHNFHNFTSKKLHSDPSVHRYIMNFTCGEPFMIDGIEFVTCKVKGQSFMFHQIRKMMGLMIAIVRGLTTTDTLVRSWDKDKLDIPIAPGLGLLLEEVHYDRYNQRYGNDGMHEKIDWSEWAEDIEQFKKKYILPTVVETEKNEKSMLTWLESLNLHSFDVRNDHIHMELDKALENNKRKLSPLSREDPLKPTKQRIMDTDKNTGDVQGSPS